MNSFDRLAELLLKGLTDEDVAELEALAAAEAKKPGLAKTAPPVAEPRKRSA